MTITEVYQAKNSTLAAKITENLGLLPRCDDLQRAAQGQAIRGHRHVVEPQTEQGRRLERRWLQTLGRPQVHRQVGEACRRRQSSRSRAASPSCCKTAGSRADWAHPGPHLDRNGPRTGPLSCYPPHRTPTACAFASPLLVAGLALPGLAAAQQSALGRWKTIDDATRKPKSVVEVYQARDGRLAGKVVEILTSGRPQPGLRQVHWQQPRQADQGLVILWGLSADGAASGPGGRVMDPENGRTTRRGSNCSTGGRKLGMSGCISFLPAAGLAARIVASCHAIRHARCGGLFVSRIVGLFARSATHRQATCGRRFVAMR